MRSFHPLNRPHVALLVTLPVGLCCAAVVSPFAQAADPPDQPAGAETAVRVMHIPLTGVFGEDFDQDGVRDALQFAKKNKYSQIVFEMDSPGGHVDCAKRISAVLDEFDGSFDYSAVIKKAFSASLWVLTHCDHVYIDDGGAVGAAVVYQRQESTGEVSVDAKMISATAAELGGMAEKKGVLPPVLVRAMVEPEAQVYAWHDDNGKRVLSGTAPEAKVADLDKIDSATSVLSLTPSQCVDLGFAEPRDRLVERSRDWKEPTAYGAAAMKRNGDKVRDLFRKVEKVKRDCADLKDLLKSAVELEKDLTPAKIPKWRATWIEIGKEAKKLIPQVHDLKDSPEIDEKLEERLKDILKGAEARITK